MQVIVHQWQDAPIAVPDWTQLTDTVAKTGGKKPNGQ